MASPRPLRRPPLVARRPMIPSTIATRLVRNGTHPRMPVTRLPIAAPLVGGFCEAIIGSA